MNASDANADFWDPTRSFGEAHVALVLARREGGNQAFEDLYLALGRQLHQSRLEMGLEVLDQAVLEAGLGDLAGRALADPSLPHAVIGEHHAARARDVFGVPTLALAGSKVLYGPILPLAPVDDEAMQWWDHIRWLLERPDFFELKRWPRDIRPGTITTS